MNPTNTASQNQVESAGSVAVGLLLAGIGCGWWMFDADPQHGRALLAAGLAVAGFGVLLKSHRIGTWGRFAIIASVVLLAMVAAFELRDLVVEIRDARQVRLLHH